MKYYLLKLYNLLTSKKALYIILFTLIISTLLAHHKFGIRVHWLFYFLIAFILSYIIQSLLSSKKFIFYVCRWILFLFIIGQLKFIFGDERPLMKRVAGSPDLHEEHVIALLANRWPAATITEYLTSPKLIYSITVSTDSLGRRIGDKENAFNTFDTIKSKQHSVFLGCSFTFGSGLNYSSSFPFLFEQSNPQFVSYNYGKSGIGPHQIALLFDDGLNILRRDAIKEKEGFAIYTFITDHLDRVYGSSHCLAYDSSSPDVYVKNDSLIVRDRNKFYVWAANLLNRVGLFNMLHLYSWSYPKTDAYYQRFAGIVNYIAKKYWELYPGNKFYVAVYPYDEPADLTWIKYLTDEIEMITMDFPSDYFQNPLKYKIKNDGHPTRVFNEYFTQKISEVINKKEIQEIAE